MVSQLLIYKILQLFVIMIFGYILVKTGIVKSQDSLILSKLSLYLFMPAVIINAFNMEITSNIIRGLILAFVTAILIHIILFVIDLLCKKLFKCTNVERASIMYSNAGNLIVPIVAYILGEEWIIYSCAYLIVQIVFLWTHGVRLFSGKEKPGIKKIILNVNIITVFICLIMLIFGLKLPGFVSDITSSLGNMLAPAGMIIAGMLAAGIDFKKILTNKRIYFVATFRLIICPLIIMALIKGILLITEIENADKILLISYLATITPSASTVMQFAQLYNQDADLSVMYNVVTTILCIISMPLLVALF